MFVIRRVRDGQFVTPAGSRRSYTRKLEKAQTYPSRNAAQANACPANENVCAVSDLFDRSR